MPAPTASERLRVVYIGGYIHNGSTLVGSILGETGGLFCAGELRFFWRSALPGAHVCTCGRVPRECPFWRPVLEALVDGGDGLDAERLARVGEELLRARRFGRLVRQLRRKRRTRELEAYAAALERLYEEVRRRSGCHTIVDTSKLPQYAYLLARLPSIDLSFVELVRDPRGIRNSSRKRGRGLEPGLLLAAGLYDAWHLFARLGFPERLSLRYEDVARDPAPALARILVHAGVEAAPPSLGPGREIALDRNHALWANSFNPARGIVRIRPDLAWRSDLPRRERLLTTLLTWPLMLGSGHLGRGRQAG